MGMAQRLVGTVTAIAHVLGLKAKVWERFKTVRSLPVASVTRFRTTGTAGATPHTMVAGALTIRTTGATTPSTDDVKGHMMSAVIIVVLAPRMASADGMLLIRATMERSTVMVRTSFEAMVDKIWMMNDIGVLGIYATIHLCVGILNVLLQELVACKFIGDVTV